MFVPVACSECGKPFQVPDAAIGKPTVCPWCQASVLALPLGAPVVQPAPAVPPVRQNDPEPEPLPLDDAPAPALPAPSRGWFRWWIVPVAVVVLVLAAGITIAVLRYKQGHMVDMEWKEFTPPDNSCTIELLGRPTEDTDTASGERRYVSEGWYSGTTAWVGWRDLSQIQIQYATAKDGWVQLLPMFQAERDKWMTKFGASVTAERTQFDGPTIYHDIRLTYPRGQVIERMTVIPVGSRPRVYFIGMAGKIDLDSPEVKRLFDSFRVKE